jgi:hypothetical protein
MLARKQMQLTHVLPQLVRDAAWQQRCTRCSSNVSLHAWHMAVCDCKQVINHHNGCAHTAGIYLIHTMHDAVRAAVQLAMAVTSLCSWCSAGSCQ